VAAFGGEEFGVSGAEVLLGAELAVRHAVLASGEGVGVVVDGEAGGVDVDSERVAGGVGGVTAAQGFGVAVWGGRHVVVLGFGEAGQAAWFSSAGGRNR